MPEHKQLVESAGKAVQGTISTEVFEALALLHTKTLLNPHQLLVGAAVSRGRPSNLFLFQFRPPILSNNVSTPAVIFYFETLNLQTHLARKKEKRRPDLPDKQK